MKVCPIDLDVQIYVFICCLDFMNKNKTLCVRLSKNNSYCLNIGQSAVIAHPTFFFLKSTQAKSEMTPLSLIDRKAEKPLFEARSFHVSSA